MLLFQILSVRTITAQRHQLEQRCITVVLLLLSDITWFNNNLMITQLLLQMMIMTVTFVVISMIGY